jgi:hypothetical protein
MTTYNYKGQLCSNCYVLYGYIRGIELQLNELRVKLGMNKLRSLHDFEAFSQTVTSPGSSVCKGSLLDLKV